MGLVGEFLALKYIHSASFAFFFSFKEVKFAILR